MIGVFHRSLAGQAHLSVNVASRTNIDCLLHRHDGWGPMWRKGRLSGLDKRRNLARVAVMEPLCAWLRAGNIWYDPRLELVRTDADEDMQGSSAPGTLAVIARACIRPGTVVARIPCVSLLCVPYCALFKLPLCKKALKICKPSLRLALCVLYEQLLGSSSRFDKYLRHCSPVSLPSTDGAWEDDSFFAYTEAWHRLKRRQHAYQEGLDYPGTCRVSWQRLTQMELHDFWQAWAQPILGQALTHTPRFDEFLSAFSIVSSRAFIIDLFHGYVDGL